MFASRSRFNITKKTIAIGVAVVFLFSISGQAWALEEPDTILSGSGMGGGLSPGQLRLDLKNLRLPLSLGYVKEAYNAETERPKVIYIQDAHANYSCQKSIQSIIKHFNENYGVHLAAIEGGAGNYDLSIFTSIPDVELRERVVDYFVREGRVTGVEMFSSLNPDKLTIKGLEEPALYEKNLNVYRESLTFKDKVDKYLDILKHFVKNLKPPIFSKKIKEFDTEKTAYDDNKNKLKDYVVYLGEISHTDNIKIEKFQNLSKLLKLIKDEENVNFKKAEREREALLDLSTKKLSKLEIANLVEKSIDFKNKDLSASDFYEQLFRKAQSCNIDLSQYPNLLKYKAYVDKYDNVEKDVFFEEIFDAERYIADNLFKTDDERKLFYLSDDLSILDKLFSVSLTRRLYDYYHGKKDELKVKEIVRFIREKASWHNMPASINPEVERLDLYKDKMGSFYHYSFERDKVFIKNLDRYSKGKEAIFMITGGFHTENMIELLKKHGYSYALITPKIMSQKDNPYFHLLAGGLSPIQSILSEYTAALALRSPFSEMGEEGVRRFIEQETELLLELKRVNISGPATLERGIYLTISLQNPEAVLTQEEISRAVVEIRPAGTFGAERLFATVHREEDLFDKYIVESEIRAETPEEGRPIPAVAEEEISGAPGYAEQLRKIRAETAPAIRPGFSIPVILETSDRMLVSYEKMPVNIKQQIKRQMRTQVKSLVGHDGEIELIFSESREDTQNIANAQISQDRRPVIFTLDAFGVPTDEFKELLQGNRVPWITLQLKSPIEGVEHSGESVVEPFTIAQIAVLMDELDRVYRRDEPDRAQRIEVLQTSIMHLKASVEQSAFKPFAGSPEEMLYTGSLALSLPRITEIDISGDIDTYYRALLKIERAL